MTVSAKNIADLSGLVHAAAGSIPGDVLITGARVLNVFTQHFTEADILIVGDRIAGVGARGSWTAKKTVDLHGATVVPSFIDAHMHIESTLLTPASFAAAAASHGTGTVIADPHEIANVCGIDGIRYMLENSCDLPLDVFLTASSCVPAMPEDENAGPINHELIAQVLDNPRVVGLAELMNFTGTVDADPEILAKILAAKTRGKVRDGHAPGLTGKRLCAYAAAGVMSDHECTNIDEALEKISLGQHIMIREGSACQNLKALMPLFEEPYCRRAMLCTDDCHADMILSEGHIDRIVRLAIAHGADPATAYTMASFNAASYFGLSDRGAIAPGYRADFTVISNIRAVAVRDVWKNGMPLSEFKKAHIAKPSADASLESLVRSTVHIQPVTAADFAPAGGQGVIGLIPGQILTTDEGVATSVDIENDILRIAVVERHHATGHIGLGYIKGYGIRRGAVATSVAHDAHNIIVVGTNGEDMACAVKKIEEMKGGICVTEGGRVKASLALDVAGLMTDRTAQETADALDAVKDATRHLGVSDGIDSILTLSFMSLVVIPTLRITTHGLVHCKS